MKYRDCCSSQLTFILVITLRRIVSRHATSLQVSHYLKKLVTLHLFCKNNFWRKKKQCLRICPPQFEGPFSYLKNVDWLSTDCFQHFEDLFSSLCFSRFSQNVLAIASIFVGLAYILKSLIDNIFTLLPSFILMRKLHLIGLVGRTGNSQLSSNKVSNIR